MRGILADGLKANIESRFSDVLDLEDRYACMATYIDPHHKHVCFGSKKNEVKEIMPSEMNEMFSNQQDPQETQATIETIETAANNSSQDIDSMAFENDIVSENIIEQSPADKNDIEIDGFN